MKINSILIKLHEDFHLLVIPFLCCYRNGKVYYAFRDSPTLDTHLILWSVVSFSFAFFLYSYDYLKKDILVLKTSDHFDTHRYLKLEALVDMHNLSVSEAKEFDTPVVGEFDTQCY